MQGSRRQWFMLERREKACSDRVVSGVTPVTHGWRDAVRRQHRVAVQTCVLSYTIRVMYEAGGRLSPRERARASAL